MISKNEKYKLELEVKQILENNYKMNVSSINSIIAVVLENWFNELDKRGSHLTSYCIASNIVDLVKRYSYNEKNH